MGNAIVDATGVWKQTKYWPYTEVQLAMLLKENPVLANEIALKLAMEELMKLYPAMTKIVWDIKTVDDLGQVLYLTIKGKVDLRI